MSGYRMRSYPHTLLLGFTHKNDVLECQDREREKSVRIHVKLKRL